MAAIRKSLIWQVFSKNAVNKSRATYSLCNKTVARSGTKATSFTTSNLWQHTERMHKEEYAKLREDEKKVNDKKPQGAAAATGNTAAKTQATICAAFDKGCAFTRDNRRANAITKLIMETLALDDLPFNFVNNTGFQRLMKHVEPRYTMPDKKFFRTRMLPDMYGSLRCDRRR